MKIKGLFLVTRPPLTLGATLASAALLAWSKNLMLNPLRSVIIILLITFISAFFNTMNEIVDAEVDAINKPKKPIPSQMVSIEEATMLVKFFAVLSAVFLVLFALVAFDIILVLLSLAGIFTAKVYNISRERAIIGNACLGFTYFVAAFISVYPLHLLFPVAFALFTVGFNIIVQIQDIEAEALKGVKTMPVQHGIKKSGVCAVVLLSISSYLFFLSSPVCFVLMPIIPIITLTVWAMTKKNFVIELGNRIITRSYMLACFCFLFFI